ncbi:Bug family tripartite tricarboxylate transporter substrate binding protein [Cupriavidus sp. TMH.W2]|uniref:Bug family tripartite tricarboxylate transporter substrate binding protein n=1 Tax=Cupriavidus sp. TMH.W2 TaxID=3434465 RepID=UPI003D78AD13
MLVVLALCSMPVLAAYPDKPVKLVVGYAPGGATDIVARLLADRLGARWGQPVVVENKPGASGMIGALQTVRAPADGYTLLLGYSPEVSFNKLVFKEMRYDPINDLTPISLAASAPLVLFSGPGLPVSSMQELLALKPTGRPITYGSPGIGGQQHLAAEMLKRLTGLPLTHVPYRGTSAALTDLLGGQIDLFFGTTVAALPYVRAGKLKPIAVAGPARDRMLPDVPTTTELGMASLQMTNWFGVFAPAGLPPAVEGKISADVRQVLASDALVKALEEKGLTATPLQGAAFRAFIAAEMKKYQAVVSDTGLARQ